ncbi:MAG: hypothetical protein ACK4FB_09055 [Brevundimonas sp.]|uniref:hypothetical protein n=1 Tax=Brevundimonas sp. TaxID=1871086 RepID=UPI00391C775B
MALTPLPRINFPDRDPWKSPDAVTRLPGVAEPNHLGSWIFGRANPSDAVARNLCKRNRAPLARNAEADHEIFGAPVIHDDYWEFRGGLDSLRTTLFLPRQFCGYAVAWSTAGGLASSGLHRAPILSSFQNTASRGYQLAFWSATIARGIAYGGDPTGVKTVDLTTPGVAVPRLFYFERQPTGGTGDEWRTRVINLSDDSVTDDVQVVWSAGAANDELPLWIGASRAGYVSDVKLHRLELIAGAGHDLATRTAIADSVLRGHMARNTALEELTEAA